MINATSYIRIKKSQKIVVQQALRNNCELFHGITKHTVPLETRRTLNSDSHTTICLPKVLIEMRETKKRHRTSVSSSPWQRKFTHLGRQLLMI